MYGYFDDNGKMSGENTAYIYPGKIIFIRLAILIRTNVPNFGGGSITVAYQNKGDTELVLKHYTNMNRT